MSHLTNSQNIKNAVIAMLASSQDLNERNCNGFTHHTQNAAFYAVLVFSKSQLVWVVNGDDKSPCFTGLGFQSFVHSSIHSFIPVSE